MPQKFFTRIILKVKIPQSTVCMKVVAIASFELVVYNSLVYILLNKKHCYFINRCHINISGSWDIDSCTGCDCSSGGGACVNGRSCTVHQEEEAETLTRVTEYESK